MKKFILILLMTFTLTSFFAINIFAINVDYTFNITDNKKWNLETGSIEDDLKFAVTSKMIIKDDRIITSSETYHHVVFWNSKNQFIGYKNSQYSILENNYYLGNIEYGSAGFDAPANAHFFSFMIYKSGNSIPIAELNNQSLSDIFDNFTHQGNDTPLSTLNNQSLNDIFLDGQLLTNGDFSNGLTGWNTFNMTASVSNGEAILLGTAQNGSLYRTYQLTNNHNYYHIVKWHMGGQSIVYRNFQTINDEFIYPSQFGSQYIIDSFIATSDGSTSSNNIQLRQQTSAFWYAFVDYVKMYDLTDLGIDTLTKAQMDDYYDAYQRTNNNEPINDIISEYAIDYAISNNPTINLTYNEWYDYYNNYLTYQDANDRIESGLNNLSLNDVFLDGNLILNPYYPFTNTTSWNFVGGNGYIENNYLVNDFDGTRKDPRLTQPNPFTNGNDIYINIEYKYENNLPNSLLLYYAISNNNLTTNVDYVFNNFSFIDTATSNNNLIIRSTYSTDAEAGTSKFFVKNVYAIDLTDLGIDNLTTAQMDAYYDDYIDNQTLEQNLYLQALTPTSFDLIDPNYDYTAPPPDDFLDVDSDTFLDNLLTNIGFNNDLGKVTLSILILFLTTLTLIKFNLGTSVILGVDILVYVGLTFLGWLPAWINILIALIIMVLFYLRFKGGGSNNEESD